MSKLLEYLTFLPISILLLVNCNAPPGNPLTQPNLASETGDNASITINISSNGNPGRTFQLRPVAWTQGMQIERDVFYKVPLDKKETFRTEAAKLIEGPVIKAKSSSGVSGTELSGVDYAPGLCAVASANCGSSTCWGSSTTTASEYYYNTKIHVHEYESRGGYYYYSHEDTFSEYSDVDIQYENDWPSLYCEASCTRQDFSYYTLDTLQVWRIHLAASQGGPVLDSLITDNPPEWTDIVIQVWHTVEGDNVFTSEQCP